MFIRLYSLLSDFNRFQMLETDEESAYYLIYNILSCGVRIKNKSSSHKLKYVTYYINTTNIDWK